MDPPSVLLKRVAVDDEPAAFYGGPIPPGQDRVLELQNTRTELRLNPGHRHVVFDFTAVSLGSPENVEFRYRLDGFDRRWLPTKDRSVGYPRLEAGEYRFRVIARNSEGVWNEKGAELAFTVTPFVWQRWWFRIAAVGIFSVGVGGAVRYVSFRRLRRKLHALEQQSALEKERARIARDIHDDVGNRLTEISLLSELALRDGTTPKNERYVQQISSTVRHVTDSLDEIIWAVSPRNDTLPSVIHYIGEFAIEFLHTARITCRLDLPDHIPARNVSAEIRHNLFLAVKEALNNVVRHAQARDVALKVQLTPAALSIGIHDNGRGFASSNVNAPGADGLRNMRQRMEEIGGSFALRSEPGAGTEVTLAYPWPLKKNAG
jgi:signal transduction histidine kinase